ncbi:MAG TPA: translocation/assembly module TamB domain-containing protein, partial [Geobacteraceae bacterium]
DKVRIRGGGIDARLAGRLQLTAQRLDRIRSTGEIRVVKGSYKTYGIELDITRGTLYYAGSAINRPTLDIQAMRKVGDVRAGVIVAGTPKKLKTKLTSEPPMPDSQILSYIVLGQPLAYTREQSGLISRVSGQLLSAGGGYVPIQTAPPGIPQAKTAGATLSQSLLSVGRYLTPELYIGYGKSLVNNANLLRLRYSLSKHWEVESQTGTQSGGDIFFKIEFK